MNKLALRIKVLIVIDGFDQDHFRITNVCKSVQPKYGNAVAVRTVVSSLVKQGYLEKPTRGVYKRSTTFNDLVPRITVPK
jgi:hypothetical protein